MKGVRSGGGRVSVLKNKLLKRTIRGRMSWRATCVNWNFILFLISLLPFHFVLLFTLSSWVSIFITHTHRRQSVSLNVLLQQIFSFLLVHKLRHCWRGLFWHQGFPAKQTGSCAVSSSVWPTHTGTYVPFFSFFFLPTSQL